MGSSLKYLCVTIALCLTCALMGGCTKKETSTPKPTAPATVSHPVKELALTTVTLTPDAESRLGIKTAAVEFRSVGIPRTFGGEIVAMPGQCVTVSAPMTGTLLPGEQDTLKPGQAVEQGQPLFRLLLSLPQQDLMTIQQDISALTIETNLAQEAVKRAQQLLDDKVGSIRQLSEAQARLATAQNALKTARERLVLLERGDLDVSAEGLASLTLKSPISGIIQSVYAAPGQTVTSAVSLVQIASLDTVWIKVPVYAGEPDSPNTDQTARIHRLSDWSGNTYQKAKFVQAPVGANPEAVTMDLYYEMDNTNHTYRLGQKVAVTLPQTRSRQALVVSYASILYDMYGSTWIYVYEGNQIYRRERVQVSYVLDDMAVLSKGPSVGTQVVSDGAAELFGTEFGVAK